MLCVCDALFNAPQVFSLFVRTDINTTHFYHFLHSFKCGKEKMCGHYISRLIVAALQLLTELTICHSLYVALCLMPKAPFEIDYKPISFASYQRYSLWLHITDVRLFPADKISCILSFYML